MLNQFHWVAERKDVLSAAFLFLALWLYVNYTERQSLGRYLVVALAFCCALMSKPMAVTFPFIALLFDIWPLERHAA
jgi:4-amino-4-deoxy-L-arabinose transferase-like glycosyltransferase